MNQSLNRPNSPENNGLNSQKLLRIGGVAAALIVIIFAAKDKISNALNGTDVNTPEITTAPVTEQFSFHSFKAPKQGVEIDRYFEPGNKKTVISIVDKHPVPRASDEDSHQNDPERITQRELYEMLLELKTRYGSVPVVQENWLIGLDRGGMRGLPPTTGPGFETTHVLRELAHMTDPVARAKLADSVMGTTDAPAAPVLAAAYPDFNIMGTSSYQDSVETMEIVHHLMKVQEVISYPEEFRCTDTDQSLVVVMDQFQAGNRTPEVVGCYCEVQTYTSSVIEAFTQDRQIDAPRREVTAALDDPNDLIIMVAGITHRDEAKRLMQENGMNYIELAPVSIQDEVDDGITLELPLKDDSKGTCAGWAQTEQASREKERIDAIMQWMTEDDTGLHK